MGFVLFEVVTEYPGGNKRITIPVIREDVYSIASVFDGSVGVRHFKVIDSQPVGPKHFNFGSDWNKWVLEFDASTWR